MLNSQPSGGKKAPSVPPTPPQKRVKIDYQNRHKTAAPAPFHAKHCLVTDSPRDCTERDRVPSIRLGEKDDVPAGGRASSGMLVERSQACGGAKASLLSLRLLGLCVCLSLSCCLSVSWSM